MWAWEGWTNCPGCRNRLSYLVKRPRIANLKSSRFLCSTLTRAFFKIFLMASGILTKGKFAYTTRFLFKQLVFVCYVLLANQNTLIFLCNYLMLGGFGVHSFLHLPCDQVSFRPNILIDMMICQPWMETISIIWTCHCKLQQFYNFCIMKIV